MVCSLSTVRATARALMTHVVEADTAVGAFESGTDAPGRAGASSREVARSARRHPVQRSGCPLHPTRTSRGSRPPAASTTP